MKQCHCTEEKWSISERVGYFSKLVGLQLYRASSTGEEELLSKEPLTQATVMLFLVLLVCPCDSSVLETVAKQKDNKYAVAS